MDKLMNALNEWARAYSLITDDLLMADPFEYEDCNDLYKSREQELYEAYQSQTKTTLEYKKLLEILQNDLRASAINLAPMDLKGQETLANYIGLVLLGNTVDEAKTLILSSQKG